MSLNTDYCMVNIWQLQSLMDRIDALTSDDPALPLLCNRMLEQYRGDFLAGDEMKAWTVSIR